MQTNPVKAIREYCLQCSGGSSNEVKLCQIETCPLYAFRFGKNPYRQRRELTEDELEALRARMANARKSLTNNQGKIPQNSYDDISGGDDHDTV